jgi:tetratricopeptide (TPR) repeat protein
MANHHLAASVWLALAFGGIGYAARAGLEASARARQEQARTEALERMKRAFLEVEEGRVSEGLRILSELAEAHPESEAIAFNRALALIAAKEFDEADRVLARLIERRPEDWDAQAERATIALQRGQLDRVFQLLAPIPPGGGQLARRFREHPAWADFVNEPRAVQLLEKHGCTELADTALRRLAEIEAQRAATASVAPDAGQVP